MDMEALRINKHGSQVYCMTTVLDHPTKHHLPTTLLAQQNNPMNIKQTKSFFLSLLSLSPTVSKSPSHKFHFSCRFLQKGLATPHRITQI